VALSTIEQTNNEQLMYVTKVFILLQLKMQLT
jgi:hypothetical protein